MDVHRLSLEEIKVEVRRTLLIKRLRLEDVTEDDIADDTILFGEGLGLDSIEAFELMVGIEDVYGVMVEGIPVDELRAHLRTVESIAKFIENGLRK
jgi:acyl carrier protein